MALQNSSTNKYSGFITGYTAGNLEANAMQIDMHNSKIIDFIRELEQEYKKGALDSTDNEKLRKLIQDITNDYTSGKNEIEQCSALGTNLDALISYLSSLPSELPSYSLFLLKKIIYHYLNIAKTLKQESINEIAKTIADKYSAKWGG